MIDPMKDRKCPWCEEPIWRNDRTDDRGLMHYGCRTQYEYDREPQPSDGPDYHADHAAWLSRQP